MSPRAHGRYLGIAGLLTIAACASRTSTDSGYPDTSHDVANDRSTSDTGTDVHPMSDAGTDAPRDTSPTLDATDSGPGTDVGIDTGPDVTTLDTGTIDAGTPNTCVAAGGSCVALVPGSCPAPHTIGSPPTYSCGGGLGVECCLPGDAGTPTDSGATNACVAAGGSCVALAPGSCPAPGSVGAFSCGSTLGLECCIPGTADAGGPVTCVSAGGTCVGLFPGACPAPGMVGDARMYTCGGGLGLECCLPGSTADAGTGAPVCLHAGTTMEGWYAADGTLLCPSTCAGLIAHCQRIGTTAQGWYTTSGNGCPPYSTLIVHDAMCM